MERDFAHAESATSELQLELASVKQDLQEAMDLCSQHEALIEERNSELSTMQSEIRSVMCVCLQVRLCMCVCVCLHVSVFM